VGKKTSRHWSHTKGREAEEGGTTRAARVIWPRPIANFRSSNLGEGKTGFSLGKRALLGASARNGEL